MKVSPSTTFASTVENVPTVAFGLLFSAIEDGDSTMSVGVTLNLKLTSEDSSPAVRNAAAWPVKPAEVTKALAAVVASTRVAPTIVNVAKRLVSPGAMVRLKFCSRLSSNTELPVDVIPKIDRIQ